MIEVDRRRREVLVALARSVRAGVRGAGQVRQLWSPTTNVKWKVRVPGTGNSSPIVWGDRLYLTTAQNGGAKLSLLAFNRADGKQLWETVVPQNGIEHVHQKNGHASATPVTDGQLIYASFGRHGLVAFDMNGKIVWHRQFGVIDNYHGPAGSPVLYKDRVFLYQDHEGRPRSARSSRRSMPRPARRSGRRRAPRRSAGARRSSSPPVRATSWS